jgi:hypothetical protein
VEKKRFRPTEQNREQVQERRAAFVAHLSRIDAAKLVFIDESGCNVAMSLLYGRAPRGERVHDHTNRTIRLGEAARTRLKRILNKTAHARQTELVL